MVMRGEFPSRPRPGALHLPQRAHRVWEISVACSLSSLLLNGAPCLIAKPICQPMWHPTHQAQASAPPSFWQRMLNYFLPPKKNVAICTAESECLSLALSGSFWLDAKRIILISLFYAVQWLRTMQISSRTY